VAGVRLTPAERKLGKFTDYRGDQHFGRVQEPALGTLDQRLTILCSRFKGTGIIHGWPESPYDITQYQT
jgi:hypothetical protein